MTTRFLNDIIDAVDNIPTRYGFTLRLKIINALKDGKSLLPAEAQSK